MRAIGAAIMAGTFYFWWESRKKQRAEQLDALMIDTTQRIDANYTAIKVTDPITGWIDTAVTQFVSAFGAADSRGLRNNNPGNLKDFNVNWTGLANPRNDGIFLRFIAAEYGIRAMYRLLQTMRSRGLNTIRKIIGGAIVAGVKVDGWAPPQENETENYIKLVVSWTGLDENKVLSTEAEYIALMKAITRKENGSQPYSDYQYRLGIKLMPDQTVTAAALAAIKAGGGLVSA